MIQPTIDQITRYNQTHKKQTITHLHQTTKQTSTHQTTKQTSTTTPTTFPDLIKAYNTDPTNPDHLLNLATAVTYSVLRKVIDPTRKNKATTGEPANSGHSPALVSLRQSLTHDRLYLDRLTHATNGATRYTYGPDGDSIREVVDAELNRAAADLVRQALTGDGLDLVHDAALTILHETEKQATREPDQPTDLERPYTVRRLKRRVYIRVAESVNGWEEVETTPIQETFKAVRRAIQSSRAVQADPRNGYTYLSFLTTDGDGQEETLYRRLPRYMDTGSDGTYTPDHYTAGQPAGLDGRPTNYTADPTTVEDMDNILQRLNLTDQQATILKYRMQGYGRKAIATRIGARPENVTVQVRRMQDKARGIGLDPASVK